MALRASSKKAHRFGAWAFVFLVACGEPAPPPPPPVVVVAPPPGVTPGPVLTDPPTFGQQCTDDAQCPAGASTRYCLCGPGQRGGVAATGFCWSGPVVKDGRWWCTVEEGTAVEMGVVFF